MNPSPCFPSTARRRALLALGAVALLALWNWGRVPEFSPWWQTLHRVAHFPVFGILAVLMLLAYRTLPTTRGRHPGLGYVVTLVGMLLLSLATEGLQLMQHQRNASLHDVFVNMLGTVAALALFALADPQLRRLPAVRRRRPVLVLSAVACSAVALLPLLTVSLVYLHRAQLHPTLVSFASPLGTVLADTSRAKARRTRLPPRWQNGEHAYALEVAAGKRRFSTFAMRHPVPDWSGFTTLVLDVTNPEPQPLRIVLRVHDADHNHVRSDRFNVTVVIAAESRERLRVALEDVRTAPEGRDMDMSRIQGLAIYARRDGWARRYYLNALTLENRHD